MQFDPLSHRVSETVVWVICSGRESSPGFAFVGEGDLSAMQHSSVGGDSLFSCRDVCGVAMWSCVIIMRPRHSKNGRWVDASGRVGCFPQ